MPAVESVKVNPHQAIDDRLSQIQISNTHSRLNYQADRRKQLGHDFISESDITEFAIRKHKQGKLISIGKMPGGAACPLGFGNANLKTKCHKYDMSCSHNTANIQQPTDAMFESPDIQDSSDGIPSSKFFEDFPFSMKNNTRKYRKEPRFAKCRDYEATHCSYLIQ